MQLKSVPLFVRIPSAAIILVVGAMNQACVAPAQTVTPRPCDLFAPATPCVAAISATRTLYRSYTGPLYEVTRQSDNAHADIGLLRRWDVPEQSGPFVLLHALLALAALFDLSLELLQTFQKLLPLLLPRGVRQPGLVTPR